MLGEAQVYEVLAVNAFNADRKRMSILVRFVQTGEYFLMCKGADNIMLPLCAIETKEKRGIEKSLLDMAVFGLRTLCVAQKILEPAQVQSIECLTSLFPPYVFLSNSSSHFEMWSSISRKSG